MKTIKRNIMIIVMAAAFMLPVMAIEFRSTSTMVGSGSKYCANPMLNDDGTATYSGAKLPGGPRRSGIGGSNPFGDQVINDRPINDVDQPLGDAVWPMTVLALAYLIGEKLAKKVKSAAK